MNFDQPTSRWVLGSSPALLNRKRGSPQRLANRLCHLAGACIAAIDEEYPQHRASSVLCILAGHGEDRLLCDVTRLVRHALEASGRY
jgi:hypothetical protein